MFRLEGASATRRSLQDQTFLAKNLTRAREVPEASSPLIFQPALPELPP
jgi:hypothetical protein